MSKWVDANPYLNYYGFGNPIRWAYHTGADLNLNHPHWDADNGAEVYSIANGTVTFAELVSLPSTWGKLVIIRHELPDGRMVHSRYGHLSRLDVNKGDMVAIGDILGLIGGTQYGVPNHLHFDISTSGILEKYPKHWPGRNRQAVLDNYVSPKIFLLENM